MPHQGGLVDIAEIQGNLLPLDHPSPSPEAPAVRFVEVVVNNNQSYLMLKGKRKRDNGGAAAGAPERAGPHDLPLETSSKWLCLPGSGTWREIISRT